MYMGFHSWIGLSGKWCRISSRLHSCNVALKSSMLWSSTHCVRTIDPSRTVDFDASNLLFRFETSVMNAPEYECCLIVSSIKWWCLRIWFVINNYLPIVIVPVNDRHIRRNAAYPLLYPQNSPQTAEAGIQTLKRWDTSRSDLRLVEVGSRVFQPFNNMLAFIYAFTQNSVYDELSLWR